MPKFKSLTASLGGIFLLGACASLDLQEVRDMEIQGTAFHKQLHAEYLALAEGEAAEHDWRDAAFFNERARRAAMGEDFGPQELHERRIAAEARPLMEASRERLMDAFAEGAMLEKPIPAARAQAAWDCWMQEQEEGHQPEDIAACQDAFMAALRELRAVEPEPEPEPEAQPAPAPAPAPEIARNYIVFFDFDSAELSDEARSIIATAVENVGMGEVSRITMTGHADRSGPASYNMGLSQSRGQAVAEEMVRLGIDPAEVMVDYEGEREPLVQTPDGVREPQNRRVEIVLER